MTIEDDVDRSERMKLMLLEENVICKSNHTSAEEIILALSDRLAAMQAVDMDYGKRAFERERHFPTGLPTAGVGVAIPHADPEYVHHPALAAATCAQPILFRNMADPMKEIPVEIVIIAAMKDSEGQVETLKLLSEAFGEPDVLIALRDARSPGEFVRIFHERVLRKSGSPTK